MKNVILHIYCIKCSQITLIMHCFLKPILTEVNRVNKGFESNNADPTRLLDDLMNLLQTLISKVTTTNTTFNFFIHNLDDFFWQ
jgi:hypothetical protein